MITHDVSFTSEVIASWPPQNLVNPPDRGPALFIMAIMLSILEVAIVLTRTYSRLFLTRAFGVDDILICVALVFALVLAVLVIRGDRLYYIGRHVWDIPRDKLHIHFLYSWISQLCYLTCSSLIKISILLFYRRLSFKSSRAFTIATWIGIVFNVVYFCGFSISLMIMCQPLSAFWLRYDSVWISTHSFQCLPDKIPLPLSGGCSTLADLYSTILPILLVRNLQLSPRQKMALYLLFGVGFLAVTAGVVRVVFLYRLVTTERDYTWSALWECWIWTIVELGIGIFCASAPALKPVYKKVSTVVFGRSCKDNRVRSPAEVPHAQELKDQPSKAATLMSSGMHDAKHADIDVERNSLEASSVEFPSFVVEDNWPLTEAWQGYEASTHEQKLIGSVSHQQ